MRSTARSLARPSRTLTQTCTREIVKSLRHNAAAVISRTPPSGAAATSDELTRNSRSAGAHRVRVLDHFVVAGAQAISFAERGLL
jgi:DNA repair protein RadC